MKFSNTSCVFQILFDCLYRVDLSLDSLKKNLKKKSFKNFVIQININFSYTYQNHISAHIRAFLAGIWP